MPRSGINCYVIDDILIDSGIRTNAQATLSGATQTHIIDDQGDRAKVQQGVCQNTGGQKLSSAFCNSIVLHIQLDIIYLAFVVIFIISFSIIIGSGRTEY